MKLSRMLALLLLAGCAAASGASVAPAHPAPVAAACPPVPQLVVPEDFADPRRAFAPGAPALRRLQERFGAAFRRACTHGWLDGWPLLAARARYGDRVFLKNPDYESTAWIELGGAAGALSAERLIMLGFPFVNPTGRVRLPNARQLDHALLCGVEEPYGHHPEGDNLNCLVRD
jgi:hypothetical protein